MNNVENEARIFLYDLANLAKEQWFKPGEVWSLSLANEVQKTAILKKYHPTLYISGETDTLQKISTLMRRELHMAEPEIELPDERRERQLPPVHLIAFNPDRLRK